MTYWLLNSAVIAVGGDGNYQYQTVTTAEAITWLQTKNFVSRIGYPDNAKFILSIAGIHVALSREESKLQAGDEALVVRPAYRLQTGQNKGAFQPKPEDFTFGILRRLS